MVGDFGWEHEGTKSGVGTVKDMLANRQRRYRLKLYIKAHFDKLIRTFWPFGLCWAVWLNLELQFTSLS